MVSLTNTRANDFKTSRDVSNRVPNRAALVSRLSPERLAVADASYGPNCGAWS